MSNGGREGDRLYAQETRLQLHALRERFERHESAEKEKWTRVFTSVDQLRDEVHHVRQGRPTWLVTIVITALSSLCTGLAVAFIARGA